MHKVETESRLAAARREVRSSLLVHPDQLVTFQARLCIGIRQMTAYLWPLPGSAAISARHARSIAGR
jgi:hypothetical protein